MSELPTVTGQQAINAFVKAGYRIERTRGSHRILKKEGCRHLSIPVHGNTPLKKGLLRRQISVAQMTVEQFVEYLE